MRRSAWLVLLLVGCLDAKGAPGNGSGSGSGEVLEPAQPSTCYASYSLAGVDPPATAHIDPIAIDSAGIAICLHLDATNNIIRAHFGTQTDRFTASESPFGSVLRENNVKIVDGWDVTFGGSPPTTFHNLEWGMQKGEIHDVVLHVFAKSATATSRIDISMFEPFE